MGVFFVHFLLFSFLYTLLAHFCILPDTPRQPMGALVFGFQYILCFTHKLIKNKIMDQQCKLS